MISCLFWQSLHTINGLMNVLEGIILKNNLEKWHKSKYFTQKYGKCHIRNAKIHFNAHICQVEPNYGQIDKKNFHLNNRSIKF